MMKVGFIGLGMQGKYMAVNLAEAGYDLMVYDMRPEPLAELAAVGAKIAETAADSLDVIIVDSTDPVGPAEGLFGEPFFRDCFRALRNGGIIVQQSESPLYHMRIINDMRTSFKNSGFSEVLTLNFPQCVYPSGWWSATMAGKGTSPTNNIREQDIVDRSFATRYYNLGIHQAAMARPEFMLRTTDRAAQ